VDCLYSLKGMKRTTYSFLASLQLQPATPSRHANKLAKDLPPANERIPRHQLYLPQVTDATAHEQRNLCSKVLFTLGTVKRASLKLTFRSYNRKTVLFWRV